MWSSAMHFAIGFFGYPFEGQYAQSVTIEHDGVSLQSLYTTPTDICHCQFNNTLVPDKVYVVCSHSMYRYLTPLFSVALTHTTMTSLSVPLGILVVGSRGPFRHPLLSCVIRSIRTQIPRGCPAPAQLPVDWHQTGYRRCLCHASDVSI